MTWNGKERRATGDVDTRISVLENLVNALTRDVQTILTGLQDLSRLFTERDREYQSRLAQSGRPNLTSMLAIVGALGAFIALYLSPVQARQDGQSREIAELRAKIEDATEERVDFMVKTAADVARLEERSRWLMGSGVVPVP